MIRLVGPGGAGKSTAGAIVARRLGVPFRDLDAEFSARHGDIDAFIAHNGYDAYARHNVDVYVAAASNAVAGVIALSSGFLTYPPDVHPAYEAMRRAMENDPRTFVLLPSLDLETCVTEIVRRQLGRPFVRQTAAAAAAVIRQRFLVYMAVPARKITTMRSPADVADEIVAALGTAPAVTTQHLDEAHGPLTITPVP
jgi:shikimate kinase